MKKDIAETLAFDDPALASRLFGPLDEHLQLIASNTNAELFTRGTELTIVHPDSEERKLLLLLFTQCYNLLQSGNELVANDFMEAYSLLKQDINASIKNIFSANNTINTPRKNIIARNTNQREYLDLLRNNEMVFATGPAGTGKTYIAVAMAVSMLQAKRVKKIILTRPAVEAGEKLGFLPGDMEEKVNPYLRPLHDALSEMFGMQKFTALQESGQIEVAPLAFMRGRTLSDAFLILDEAQNTTREQMKMFLTRLGFGSRAVITGDITQIDLAPIHPHHLVAGEQKGETHSGLIHALHVLSNINGIAIHKFTKDDVVRHPLVGKIVNAYEKNTP